MLHEHQIAEASVHSSCVHPGVKLCHTTRAKLQYAVGEFLLFLAGGSIFFFLLLYAFVKKIWRWSQDDPCWYTDKHE